MIELTSMENGVVHYSSGFYSDDDLKDWPPISSFLAFMSSVSAHHQEGLSTNMTSIMLNFQAVVASVFSVGELKSKNIYTFIIDREMTSSSFLCVFYREMISFHTVVMKNKFHSTTNIWFFFFFFFLRWRTFGICKEV